MQDTFHKLWPVSVVDDTKNDENKLMERLFHYGCIEFLF